MSTEKIPGAWKPAKVAYAEALRAAAEDARIRGDVGHPAGVTVEDFLNGWADQLEGEAGKYYVAAIAALLGRREARS